MSADDNIPIFTAATSKSSNTASICASMMDVSREHLRHLFRILRCNRRDHGHSKHADRRHRVNVCLNPRTASGIRAGYCENLFKMYLTK